MKKFFIIFFIIFAEIITVNNAYADALIGQIRKDDFKLNRPQVLDIETKEPVSGAIVKIPSENKIDKTDNNGYFKIMPEKNKTEILSIQKEGYRPFSITIKDGRLTGGIQLELQKSSPFEIVLNDELLHLGDNSYSENSSGACQIYAPCIGPVFNKTFKVSTLTSKSKVYISIGSVIGIDTLQAMRLGQNKLTNATSSPVEIFVNKTKVGELKINGDNQKIPVPVKILKNNENNTLTVKTGINKNKDSDIDYDDIQIINMIVDIKN